MNMKKLFLLNLPYLLFVYPFDKLAQAFRLAPGSDLSGKLLSIGDGFTATLSSPWLSFHPTDLLIGIAGAVVLRMAVYLKGKNAKKYRHGIEYGSARWGTAADIAPYMDKDFFQNIPMTQTERITMASRPKQPKYARNKNILVIGGSGSGKTRFFCKPSLLQAHSSYVCTDPKGTLLPEIGAFLERKKYRIKCLNLINFRKSMKYNPLAYIRSEKDILKLVNALIMNTKGEGEKSSEDFWVKAERLYYSALIGYIWYEATEEEKNFITLLDLINASEAREDDETYQSPVDLLFSQLEEREPDHFAVKQYRKFKMAAGVVCSKRLLNQAVGKSLRTHNLKPKKGAQVMRKNEKITALYSQSEGIIRLDEGEWPVNEYTEGLPVPTGTVAWAMLDTEHGNFSISIAGIDEKGYDNYMELLIQEGFSVVENVSEKIKGENYVSVGTLLSNGEKGLSISYIPDNLTIYVSFEK